MEKNKEILKLKFIWIKQSNVQLRGVPVLACRTLVINLNLLPVDITRSTSGLDAHSSLLLDIS